MAHVIVSYGRGAGPLERQPRLGQVERLDLGFLVDAEHHRAVRRIEVEPDNIGDFLVEKQVVRNLGPLREVRLRASFGLDATDARL